MFIAASATAVMRKSKYTHAYIYTHAYTYRERSMFKHSKSINLVIRQVNGPVMSDQEITHSEKYSLQGNSDFLSKTVKKQLWRDCCR